jgi:hypothetical protein
MSVGSANQTPYLVCLCTIIPHGKPSFRFRRLAMYVFSDSINLIDTTKAAQILGVKKNTLEIWRHQKKGPPFRKIGKLVRYSKLDIHNYLDGQIRTGTSHQGYQTY